MLVTLACPSVTPAMSSYVTVESEAGIAFYQLNSSTVRVLKNFRDCLYKKNALILTICRAAGELEALSRQLQC
jgi:hypothetical protein